MPIRSNQLVLKIMKLQNNLYHIISEGTNSFLLSLNRECVIYKAHFPEQPITPGVCIIQIASELFACMLSKDIVLAEVVNAKFLSVINPVETESVTYTFSKMTIDDSNKTVKVAVVVSSEKAICAKLSLLYNIDEEH